MIRQVNKKSYSKRKTEDYILKRRMKFAFSKFLKFFYVLLFLCFIIFCVWFYKYEGGEKISKYTYDTSTSIFISMGLKIKSVEIEGNKIVPTDIILKKIFESLGDIDNKSIVLFDLDKLSTDITSIGWIESVDIKKKLPGTIIVHINERTPKFIWQSGGEIWLADEKGDLLTQKMEKIYIYLPIIVGQDSKKDIPEFLDIINGAPELAKLVTGGTKIGARRWDMNTKNGIKIKLPEEHADNAWKKLSEINKKNDLMSKNINYIDLRLENQLITGSVTEQKAEKSN